MNYDVKKTMKRILALILLLAIALPAAPALAESYKAVVTGGSLSVYAGAKLSGKAAAKLDALSVVTVKAALGNVAKIKYGNGKSGYAKLSKLTPLSGAQSAVAKRDTRIYEAPTLNARSIAVPKGYKMDVLYANDTYAIVENDGATGYALSAHLNIKSADKTTDEKSGVTVETYKATVVAGTLAFYKSASTSSKKLGTLKAGAGVTVYAQNESWAYVGKNGSFAFCKLSGLERGEGQGSDEEPAGSVKVTVTAKSAKVYKKASKSSAVIGTLKKGMEVNLLGAYGKWAYIELNSKKGYCAVSALTSQSSEGGGGEVIDGHDPLGTATVIQTSAAVYASMNTSSKASSLKMGETVSYYGYDSKWMLVGRDGEFGFMLRSALSNTTYGALKLEDSGAGVMQLETALLGLGYLDSVPNTNYTSFTSSAVMRLQAALGQSETGSADEPLLRVVYSGNAPKSPLLSATLSKGSKSENVTRLQNRLLALGYLSKESSVDGDYGNNTAGAVELFQKAAGISVTGTADSKTLKALYNASAPHLGANKDPADQTDNTTSGGSSGNTVKIPAGLASTTRSYSPGMSNAKKLEYVIYQAQQQLGKRYVFGASGPSTFDCSGLMMYCFGKIGISLQHSAKGEGYNDKWKKISSKASLIRGDMVFFNTVSDGDMCDHVGIYLGKSYCLHAGSGAGKVIISTIASGYYSRVFSWGRRVLNT